MNYNFCALNFIHEATLNIATSILLVFLSLIIIIIIIYLENRFKAMINNLSYREDLFHSLCSNVDDVFVVYDNLHKRFEYISPHFENMTGVSSFELHKNTYALFDFILPERRDELIAMFSREKPSEFTEIELEYHHPLRPKLWLVVRIYPVYRNNIILRYIACILEITQKYEAHAAMKEALSNSQKANEAKKEFLSHMSYELKTPINAIIGMTQIAKNSLDDKDKIESCLDKINSSSRNLLSLINNILDVAKADSDHIILIKEPFSIKRTIIELSSLMASQMELKNIDYQLILPKLEHDCVIGDSLRITQILGNCLSNSIKFTPDGGHIRLELSEIEYDDQYGMYQFQISDTGIGMSEDFLPHIFEPFGQEAKTLTNNDGSGLGMPIAKNLIDLMGGTIQVESMLAVGTNIVIQLRLEIAVKPADNITDTRQLKSIPKEDFGDLCALVVEDNEINQEITSEYLKYYNIMVEIATNGYDAIKLFEASDAGHYDFILMDVQMPGISGYETSNRIRASKHPDADHICIIAISADNCVDLSSCRQHGINHHISKPIDIDHFYSLLSNIH